MLIQSSNTATSKIAKDALRSCIALLCVLGSMHLSAATITTDSSVVGSYTTSEIDIDRLLPLHVDNQWTYSLTKFPNGQTDLSTVTAIIGAREGLGRCRALRPIVFGEELTLYLGNKGDSIALYGMYLQSWQGLEDVLIKFETRQRFFWQDIDNLHTSGNLNASSCQNTEWGRAESSGLALLEFIDPALVFGRETNSGQVVCDEKNYELTAEFNGLNGVQNGSGSATVGTKIEPFTWRTNEVVVQQPGSSGSTVDLTLDFVAKIRSVQHNMIIDIQFSDGVGINALSITSATSNNESDLVYALQSQSLASTENQLSVGGSAECQSNRDASLSIAILFGLFGIFGFRLKAFGFS